MTDDEVREAVLRAAKELDRRRLVSGTAGNVSGRLADGDICVTPSSLPYDTMTLDDLVTVDLDGEQTGGEHSPTAETPLHTACYRAHSEVRGVVHSHPLYASMFAVAHRPIPAVVEESVVYIGGDVPVCDYHPSGSDELAVAVAEALTERSAALMANHGLVCVGKNTDDALHNTVVVEHNALIVWGAHALGGPEPVPAKVVEDMGGVYRFVRSDMWASG